MSDGFTKLSNNILTSSIWSESNDTRILWITLLAACDPTGYVAGTIPGLAALARITTDEVEAAMRVLLGPDEWSRTKDCEGRRLMEVDGGWMVLNYAAYRAKRDPETRKRQNREAQKRYRDKHNQPNSKQNCLLISRIADCKPKTEDRRQKKKKKAASAVQPKKETFVKPTIKQLKEWILKKGYSVDADEFYLKYEANGWMVEKDKKPMQSWKLTLCRWQKNEQRKADREGRVLGKPSTRSPEQAKQYQDTKSRMEAEKNVSRETCHVG